MHAVDRTLRANASDIQQLIDSVREELSAHVGEGHVADCIPKLAGDPTKIRDLRDGAEWGDLLAASWQLCPARRRSPSGPLDSMLMAIRF